MGNRQHIHYSYPNLHLYLDDINGKGYMKESYSNGVLHIMIGEFGMIVKDNVINVSDLIQGHIPCKIIVKYQHEAYTWISKVPARGPLKRGEKYIDPVRYETLAKPFMKG